MATIDEDNDIYNGGGGGAIDPESLPDDPNLMLSTSNFRTAGKVQKGWLQFPIAYSDEYRYWFLNIKKEYAISDDKRPPVWFIANSSYQLKTISFDLDLVAFYNNVNNKQKKRYLLLNVDKFAYTDDGKYLRLKKVFGINTWDIEFVDLPSPESGLFEVYIDENNSANNRNVKYNDIVAALSAGKLVYLKVLDFSSPNIYTYAFSYHDVGNKDLHFTLIEVFGGCTVVDYVIKDDNSYSYEKIDPLDLSCGLDESFTPPVKYNFTFSSLKQWYNSGFSLSPQIYLKYKNANGDYYKLRAVKLTTTEIMFSVYDPDTARNLSIILNDQDQYTVIT